MSYNFVNMLSKLRNFWSEPSNPPAGEQISTHLMRLFAQMQINCVLDVGANRGQYGQLLRAAGFTGDIFSFEPSPADYPILEQTTQGDPRWHARQLALGDENGRLTMNIFNDSVFNSFMEPTEYILSHGPKVEHTTQVPVARLDDIFAQLVADLAEPRVFLKLDTQGYDQVVLRGAEQTLPHMLALQTEVAVHAIYKDVPTYLEAIDQLNALGFDLTGLFPVARDEHLRVVEFDCVMVRTTAVGDFGALRQP